MADETASLIIKVQSDQVDTAKKRLQDLGYKADTTEKATDKLTTTFKRLVAAAATMAVVKQVTGLLGEYEATMSGVRAVTQASEADMAQLSATARELGATTRFSAREAAEGMRLLGQAGFKTTQIIAAMPGMLDLAVAGELSIADAADIASASLAGFRMRADESGRVADVLATAASSTNTNVFQLGDAMKYVAPIAASMGLSIEQTAAAVGVLSNAGLQGSMAGTGLRQVLSSLANPTKEAMDVLRAYGLTVQEVNPATTDLATIMGKLQKVGLNAADALTIFGDRGAPAVLALTNQVGSLRDLNTQMDKAGGSAKRMAGVIGDNWKGDLLGLKSAVEELALKLGDAGLTSSMREATQGATDFVRQLNDMVASGEAGAWLDLLLSKFDLIDDGFENLVTNIMGLWTMAMDWLTGDGESTVKGLIDIFVMLPENVRAVAQGIGASFGLVVEYASAAGKGIWDAFTAWFDYLVDTAANVGREIMSHLNPKAADFDYVKAQQAAYEKFAGKVGGAWDTVTGKVQGATEAWEEQITAIMDEWEANTAASDSKLAKIEELRAAYKKLKADRAAAEGAKVDGQVGRSVAETPATSHFDIQGFNALKTQLQGEEAAVMESYQKRLELIRLNTKEGSDLRIELERELNERLKVETDQAHMERAERLGGQYQAELAQLRDQLDQRLITEQEFQQKSKEAWQAYSKGVVSIGTRGATEVATKQLQMYATALQSASELTSLMSDMVGENNAAAKAMFIATKAIAIAQAIVNTELAATAALTAGPIFGIPLSTFVRATGYASVALMAAQTVMAFEHGGMIPAGQTGLVGEAGAELVKGPAVVTSARTTADMGRGGGDTTIVNVHNYTNAEATVQEREGPDGKVVDVIVRRVKRELDSDAQNGGAPWVRSMESRYGLRRGVA